MLYNPSTTAATAIPVITGHELALLPRIERVFVLADAHKGLLNLTLPTLQQCSGAGNYSLGYASYGTVRQLGGYRHIDGLLYGIQLTIPGRAPDLHELGIRQHATGQKCFGLQLVGSAMLTLCQSC